LERADQGAQVDLDAPLELAQRALLVVQGPEGSETLEVEVRWVTRAGERYRHGLIVR